MLTYAITMVVWLFVKYLVVVNVVCFSSDSLSVLLVLTVAMQDLAFCDPSCVWLTMACTLSNWLVTHLTSSIVLVLCLNLGTILVLLSGKR